MFHNQTPRSRGLIQYTRAGFLGMAFGLIATAGIAPVAHAQMEGGAVFTQTNDPAGNAIVVFKRAEDGTLKQKGMVPTGGKGAGGGLGNQGGVILSPDHHRLFAVNAGSNDISAFLITPRGLRLTDRVASGGDHPVSLTMYGNLLYVVNAGGVNNITGFRVGGWGTLHALPLSSRPLSADSTGAAQISFNQTGDLLLVTEKATNTISTYTVDEDGLTQGPIVNPSQGMTPFGFGFGKRGLVIVSEAAGGASNASSVSSYGIRPDGSLEVVSSAVATGQTAACWIAVTGNGRFAYATNTGSSTITGYRVHTDGTLSLLGTDGVVATSPAGSTSIDMAMSRNSRYLYELRRSRGEISAYRIEDDGSLTRVGTIAGLPNSVNGLAAE